MCPILNVAEPNYSEMKIMCKQILQDQPSINLLIGPNKDSSVHVNLELFSYLSIKTSVLGSQKNCLIETVLLSTHNICFA